MTYWKGQYDTQREVTGTQGSVDEHGIKLGGRSAWLEQGTVRHGAHHDQSAFGKADAGAGRHGAFG